MKKTLAFLTAAIVAVAAQAATVTWESGELYLPNGDPAGDGDINAYYFVVFNNGDAAYDGAYSTMTSSELVSAYQSGKLASDAIASSGAIPSEETWAGTYADWDQSIETSIGQYAYAVAIFRYNDGTQDLFAATGSSAQINSFGDQNGGQTIAEFALANSNGWNPAPVPEPTSVALLALGLAALGLKRKVA